MEINIAKAADIFFPNPSLELVYFEALANSIDAKATQIDIEISIKDFNEPETFKLLIKDNGEGFTKDNFLKFSKLLEVEEEDHKGVGRLVFLKYFDKITINSNYSNGKRTFEFSSKFEGNSEESTNQNNNQTTTELKFTGYKLDKIKSYDYLKPVSLKDSILLHFFPLLYSMKLDKKELTISIKLNCQSPNTDYGFFTDVQQITLDDLPDLEKITFQEPTLNLIDEFTLYYSVKKKELVESSTNIIAVCVDGRTIPIKLPGSTTLPDGYELIFLLYSQFFTGKVDSSRQELKINEAVLRQLKRIFKNKIVEIIKDAIPEIKEKNKEIKVQLENKYPHLTGYFEDEELGIMDRNISLEQAQTSFFQDQKGILEATHLSEEQYNKSLEISSRLLMEYILYRNFTINKLKTIDYKNSEEEIHDIIVPRGTKVTSTENLETLFQNNVWILDDKYMTFSTVLSEKRMDDLYKEITLDGEEIESDGKRPDIAIVFSNDPNKVEKVDVVIIELKKTGIGLAKQEEVVSQLKQRARKIYLQYADRIQRIWFYGVAEIEREFERSLLEDEFIEIFSKGKVFYKEHSIIPDLDSKIKVPVGLFVLSYEALLEDAESRNSTFMELLKSTINQN
jgi:hypothetical protein